MFLCYSCLVFMGLVAWIKTDDDDDDDDDDYNNLQLQNDIGLECYNWH